MKKDCAFRNKLAIALLGVVCAITLICVTCHYPVFGADSTVLQGVSQLHGFSLQANGSNALQVTLHVDHGAQPSYTIAKENQTTTIILSGTDLAKEQFQSGSSVVVDPKNRYIGQVIPLANHQVKIILPDTAHMRIAITPVSTTTKPPLAGNDFPYTLPPRMPSQNAPAGGYFESIATHFQVESSLQHPGTFISHASHIIQMPSLEHTKSTAPVRSRWRLIRSVVHSPGNTQVSNIPAATMPSATIPDNGNITQNASSNSSSSLNNLVGFAAKAPAENSRFEDFPSPATFFSTHIPEPSPTSNLNDTLPTSGLAIASSSPPNTEDASQIYAATPTIETPINQNSADTGGLNFLSVAEHQTAEKTHAKEAVTEGLSVFRVLLQELKQTLEILPGWLWICLGAALGSLSFFAISGAILLLKLLFAPLLPNMLQPSTNTIVAENPASSEELLKSLQEFLRQNPALSQENASSASAEEDEPRFSTFQMNNLLLQEEIPPTADIALKTAVQNASLLKFPVNRRYADDYPASRKTHASPPSTRFPFLENRPVPKPAATLQEIAHFSHKIS